jgi:hypothetical protein
MTMALELRPTANIVTNARVRLRTSRIKGLWRANKGMAVCRDRPNTRDRSRSPPRQKLSTRTSSRRRRHRVDLNESST